MIENKNNYKENLLFMAINKFINNNDIYLNWLDICLESSDKLYNTNKLFKFINF